MKIQLEARKRADAAGSLHRNELSDYLSSPLEEITVDHVVQWWGVSTWSPLYHSTPAN
jgi:hypothetical protein